jgi:hypothetical protein
MNTTTRIVTPRTRDKTPSTTVMSPHCKSSAVPVRSRPPPRSNTYPFGRLQTAAPDIDVDRSPDPASGSLSSTTLAQNTRMTQSYLPPTIEADGYEGRKPVEASVWPVLFVGLVVPLIHLLLCQMYDKEIEERAGCEGGEDGMGYPDLKAIQKPVTNEGDETARQ